MMILCIVSIGIYSIVNTEYTFDVVTYNEHYSSGDTSYLAYLTLASTSFPPLMGILGGGFYFHNISLPVIRNAKNPENNIRDVMIGYVLVLLTYTLIGVLGYLGFTGSAFEGQNPMGPNGIQQDCLNMFSSTSKLGTFMRSCAFLQLFVVNALLFACERA